VIGSNNLLSNKLVLYVLFCNLANKITHLFIVIQTRMHISLYSCCEKPIVWNCYTIALMMDRTARIGIYRPMHCASGNGIYMITHCAMQVFLENMQSDFL